MINNEFLFFFTGTGVAESIKGEKQQEEQKYM